MFWGSLGVVFSFTFAVIYNENYEIIENVSMIFFKSGDLKILETIVNNSKINVF